MCEMAGRVPPPMVQSFILLLVLCVLMPCFIHLIITPPSHDKVNVKCPSLNKTKGSEQHGKFYRYFESYMYKSAADPGRGQGGHAPPPPPFLLKLVIKKDGHHPRCLIYFMFLAPPPPHLTILDPMLIDSDSNWLLFLMLA